MNDLKQTHQNLTFGDFAKSCDVSFYYLLRHDIDRCPNAALKMAELEAQIGVRATYFLLPNSINYNLFSPEYIFMPHRLVELGHEVGLHYDVDVIQFHSTRTTAEKILRKYISLLETLTGRRVHSIAMHNPSTSREDPFKNTNRYLNAYAPCFTKEIAYFSDAGGAWRDRAYRALTTGPRPSRLQILIHPVFWSDKPGDCRARLKSFIDAQHDRIEVKRRMMENSLKKHPGVIESDCRNSSQSPWVQQARGKFTRK